VLAAPLTHAQIDRLLRWAESREPILPGGAVLRVTVVATGLGTQQMRKQKPVMVHRSEESCLRTGTDNEPVANSDVDYAKLDTPTVIRTGRREQIEAMEKSGADTYDIPTFLRKQAD